MTSFLSFNNITSSSLPGASRPSSLISLC
jgi:hypothetical protein